MKFAPTPDNSNLHELKTDLKEFTRKLRLIEQFGNKEDGDNSRVRNRSNYVPPKNRNQTLEKCISNIENIPIAKNNKNLKKNTNKEEKFAIKSLSEDTSIVIKEADKGGATVIMDREHYKKMTFNILNDVDYYEKLKSDPTKLDRIKYNKFVERYQECLTEKELDYLLKFETRQSNFYGLPKVHKSQEITEFCRRCDNSYIEIPEVEDLKLRPIIAGPSCQTHRLSDLLDLLLRPYVKHIKSHIRDSTDFLNSLPEKVPTDTSLVSFDIVNLYSNIAHDLGIRAIDYWLEKYPEELESRFSKQFILEGMELILKNNTFYFNGDFYRQNKGTAMGTKFAPVYATLVVGFLEVALYNEAREKFGDEYTHYIEENWKRFLDDVFIPWTKSAEDLESFHILINNLHTDITFTKECSTKKQAFLDTMVMNKNGNIETDIYYKPTDSKQYLLFDSCHPRHTKTSIPFSLARRLRVIISEDDTLKKRFAELKILLKTQHYPDNLIENGIKEAMKIRQEDLRKVKIRDDQKVLPFISTFNPNNPDIFNQIRTNISILDEDNSLKETFEKYNLIRSKRQPPNLKKLLTRAKFEDTSTQEIPTITKCGRPNCGTCDLLVEGSSYEFRCGKTFTVKTSMSCDVKNVIYVIRCEGCGKDYIGETGDFLRRRVTVHKQQIRDVSTRMLFVSEHIDICAGNRKTNFKIFPFYKIHRDSDIWRKNKESFFISCFRPQLNSRTGTT